MPCPGNCRRGLGAATAVWILLLAAGGCGKKTVGPEAPAVIPFAYLPPSSPQNVLRNLVSAYTRRDTVQTAIVYSPLYQGTSVDPAAPTQLPSFTKHDEIHHVGALKRNNNIVSVFVDLGPPSAWQRLPANASDPPGWAIIPIPASTIRVEDVGTATTYQATNPVMEYAFEPTVTAPGDTTWTVVRWTEIAN